MTTYLIKDMTLEAAKEINEWTYAEPYSLYSMSGDPDDLEELMDGSYVAAYANDQLTGYFCYGKHAQVPAGKRELYYEDNTYTDIGLGLHPALTGSGRGRDFLTAGMKFGIQRYGFDKYRLSVAGFNERAIRLYEQAGFEKTGSFVNQAGERNIQFFVMKQV
ncbi:GNAT family N-acetyltransferase [Jeotgalibacillus terrae]|uniref:GNAT family N-acetyltransferase n=1 Tax=Jeotgalibacillus terrae TaxID=587735 RepID=A0ABW5ZHD6_9BACL|nr:GNAT family N-acetyltransferase [Jeotgalibacillus terrae]MBM7578700.1 ribosomal protein S18 acetylase RimI-like enzyme [Jeotgalibacillus terrae]